MSSNKCDAYLEALPGLVPTDTDNGNVRPDGSGLSGSIKDTHIEADGLGNINILIDGPFSKDLNVENLYDVFITKEDPRNKLTILEVKDNVLLDFNQQPTPITAVIKVTDSDNDTYENYWLHLSAKDILLARGTYVVYAYKNQTVDNPSTDLTPTKVLVYKCTLTIKTDPVQGRAVNMRYLKTAYRPMPGVYGGGIGCGWAAFQNFWNGSDDSDDSIIRTLIPQDTPTLLKFNKYQTYYSLTPNSASVYRISILLISVENNIIEKIVTFSADTRNPNSLIMSDPSVYQSVEMSPGDFNVQVDMEPYTGSNNAVTVTVIANQRCVASVKVSKTFY